MAEYIDKQAAIEAVNSVPAADWVSKRYAEALEKIPPADVRPVVRSQWKKNDNGTYSCKRCNSWIPKQQWHYANYCLYCGADMRGGTYNRGDFNGYTAEEIKEAGEAAIKGFSDGLSLAKRLLNKLEE